MKDSMNMLFSDRFHGHEMPVDPGVWQGIQQQMAHAATASGADGLTNLFKDRFQGHETLVDPTVWQGISAQLGHTVWGTTAGSSFLGWAAAGVVAIAIGTVAYVTLGDPKTTTISELPNIPTGQVVPINMPEAPTAELVRTAIEPVSQEPIAAPPATAPSLTGPAPIGPSMDPVALEPPPTQAGSPGVLAQPPPPTKEGTAVVEGIIADITTEVKQQVLEQRIRPQTPDPLPTSTNQDGAEPETPTLAMPELFVPNIFTPNGDGPNDVYQIGSEGFDQVLIRVYSVKDNRLVFSTNSSDEHWTGASCEDGMYLVAVEARTPDGRTATEGKVVWLNRNP